MQGQRMIIVVLFLSAVCLIVSKPVGPARDYQVMRKVINTPDAPAPVAPFNQAIQLNYMVYLSGQIGLDPQTGKMVPGDVRNQTRQVLRNLQAVLHAAGSSVDQLTHCLIMLTNIDDDYETVNEIYAQWFTSAEFYPSRSSMGVKQLALNATVAIECQAYTTVQNF